MREQLSGRFPLPVESQQLYKDIKERYPWVGKVMEPLQLRSEEYFKHSLRVATLIKHLPLGQTPLLQEKEAAFLGNWKEELVVAGLVHDNGKANIPLLQKDGEVYDVLEGKQPTLTSEEYEVMITHVIRGAENVAPYDPLKARIIRGHHAHQSQPYPPDEIQAQETEGVKLAQKVIVLADVVDATLLDRSYQSAQPVEKIRRELIEDYGFHPDMVDAAIAAHRNIRS